jgi:hypothetical protein
MSIPLKSIIFITPDLPRGKQTKQKIIEIDKTSEKQWNKFKERIDKKILESNLEEEILNALKTDLPDNETSNTINNIWVRFDQIIISSALHCLQCSTKIQTNHQNNYGFKKITKKKTIEFKHYRIAVKILTKWQTEQSYSENNQLAALWKSLKDIHSITGMPTELPTSSFDLELIWRNKTEREKFTEQLKITTKHLKNICLKGEKHRIRKEIKEAIDERCINLQRNQRKIVQTLTNNFQKKIIIDRIKVKDTQGEEYIETLNEEVLKQTEEYYKKAFKKRNSNFMNLEESWKNQYEPKEFIKQEWFRDIEKEILNEELENIIQDLPNNKAAGPSKIKYEMLKHLGHRGIRTLRTLFNLFLQKSKTPLSWKQSLLYLIPKGKE